MSSVTRRAAYLCKKNSRPHWQSFVLPAEHPPSLTASLSISDAERAFCQGLGWRFWCCWSGRVHGAQIFHLRRPGRSRTRVLPNRCAWPDTKRGLCLKNRNNEIVCSEGPQWHRHVVLLGWYWEAETKSQICALSGIVSDRSGLLGSTKTACKATAASAGCDSATDLTNVEATWYSGREPVEARRYHCVLTLLVASHSATLGRSC